MNDDDPSDSRLVELLRLAEDLRESFAGKPEMEREDAAAAVYLRILREMTALERAEPAPDEKLH